MDWPLKIAVIVLSVCLIVAAAIGICFVWGLDLGADAWEMMATAMILMIVAGYYIALTDTLQRIKKD